MSLKLVLEFDMILKNEEEFAEAFFKGRFRSLVVQDEEALQSKCAFIDLNTATAGIVKSIERAFEYFDLASNVAIGRG